MVLINNKGSGIERLIMNVYDEICVLPQYYYQWENGDAVFGGQSCDSGERGDFSIILEIWKSLKEYYEADGANEKLSDKEKTEYAKAVYRMMVYCEGNTISRKEIKEKIDKLSKEEEKEIEWKIDMYNRGRRYYGQYVHNK